MITWYIIWALICPVCGTYVERISNSELDYMLGECPKCHVTVWLEKVYVKKTEELWESKEPSDGLVHYKKIETIVLDKREESRK